MMHDHKKALMSMMAKRGAKDGSISSSPVKSELPLKDEYGNVDGRHSAAEDILNAMHEKSPHKLVEALSNFHDLHKLHKEKGEAPLE